MLVSDSTLGWNHFRKFDLLLFRLDEATRLRSIVPIQRVMRGVFIHLLSRWSQMLLGRRQFRWYVQVV